MILCVVFVVGCCVVFRSRSSSRLVCSFMSSVVRVVFNLLFCCVCVWEIV